MKIWISIQIFLVLFLFIACGPSQRELAVQKINLAKIILANGDTLDAISALDSIPLIYPEATVQKGVASNIVAELYRQLIDNKIEQSKKLDSLILMQESKFTKEKTEFDQYVRYVPKRQTFKNSWDRSFLQVNLDERGELSLSSNYMGKDWLKHVGIRVYDGDLNARTDSVLLDDPDNHRSEFLDYKWEQVTYRNGKSDSVIHFIADHPELKLKCVFLGKRYYYIVLEQYDVQAVIDALRMSEIIKRKKALEAEIKGYWTKQH